MASQVNTAMRALAAVSKKVDELGELQAQISNLCKKEKAIKDLLKQQNIDVIEGNLFKATISRYDHTSLIRKEVEKLLTPAQIKKCTQVTPSTKVTLTAKTKG